MKKLNIILITLTLAINCTGQIFTTSYGFNTDHYDCFTEFSNTSSDTIWLRTLICALTGNWWNTTTTQDSVGTIINPDTSLISYGYAYSVITNWEIRIPISFSPQLKVNPGATIEIFDFTIWPKVPGTISSSLTIQPLTYTVSTRSSFTYRTTAGGTTKINTDTWRWQTTP